MATQAHEPVEWEGRRFHPSYFGFGQPYCEGPVISPLDPLGDLEFVERRFLIALIQRAGHGRHCPAVASPAGPNGYHRGWECRCGYAALIAGLQRGLKRPVARAKVWIREREEG